MRHEVQLGVAGTGGLGQKRTSLEYIAQGGIGRPLAIWLGVELGVLGAHGLRWVWAILRCWDAWLGVSLGVAGQGRAGWDWDFLISGVR
jgi:hypothetical protein